jgi:hypothetical protein
MFNENQKAEIAQIVRDTMREDPDGIIETHVEHAIYGPEGGAE